MKLVYPPKPWTDGQTAEITPGMVFMYSSSMKNWVPITPGYESKTQLSKAFGVETLSELNAKLVEIDIATSQLDSDIQLSGRIWKTINRPVTPQSNDIWFEFASGKFFYYNKTFDTWVEK